MKYRKKKVGDIEAARFCANITSQSPFLATMWGRENLQGWSCGSEVSYEAIEKIFDVVSQFPVESAGVLDFLCHLKLALEEMGGSDEDLLKLMDGDRSRLWAVAQTILDRPNQEVVKYRAFVDYDEPIRDLLKIAKLGYGSEDQTILENCALQARDSVELDFILFHPEKDMSFPDTHKAMRDLGIRPADCMSEVLSFSIKHKHIQRIYCVRCSGVVVSVAGRELIPCLSFLGSRRIGFVANDSVSSWTNKEVILGVSV